MYRALQLASLGIGSVTPNPLVGAIVLNQEGKLVGEGFHFRAGEPHAEVGALHQAGDAPRDALHLVEHLGADRQREWSVRRAVL